jgi:predicted transglutaminase-like cysteine proteinase
MKNRVLAKAWVSLAAAAVAMPGTANAQAVPTAVAGSLALSKSEAILGAPSALEAILAQQHAAPRLAAVLQPASYSMPRPVNAVLRTGRTTDEGVRSGRPDVYGSVALSVGHTPLDARWRAVENGHVTGSAARFAETLRQAAPLKQLEGVNWYVNRRVRFQDDEAHFGRPDVWSSANDTFRSGRGDCEDFAIAKMQMLRELGFSSHDLYLVIVRDLVRRADHAVLVARAAGRMVVLDNGTDELLDSARVSDYRPVLTFASYGEWTHGYRLERAPVTVAANEEVPVTRPIYAQRSLSASLLALNTGIKR